MMDKCPVFNITSKLYLGQVEVLNIEINLVRFTADKYALA